MEVNCAESTAPIDINDTPTNTCDLKCKYSFKYKESTSTITNNQYYLSLTYEQSFPEPVIFNANTYQVNEIRIYSPSLHTYSGIKSDAEIIIIHSGSIGNLLVCIPLIKTQSVNSSTEILNNIIINTNKYAKNTGDKTLLTQTINLNTLIPNKKYYSYNATLPFPPCDGIYSYVVFSKDDGAFSTINENQLITLQNLISKHNISIKKGIKFYVNKNGPGLISNDVEKGDDIYIDCKPLSPDGDIIDETINTELPKNNKLFQSIDIKQKLTNMRSNGVIKIIVIILLMYIILKLFSFIINKL